MRSTEQKLAEQVLESQDDFFLETISAQNAVVETAKLVARLDNLLPNWSGTLTWEQAIKQGLVTEADRENWNAAHEYADSSERQTLLIIKLLTLAGTNADPEKYGFYLAEDEENVNGGEPLVDVTCWVCLESESCRDTVEGYRDKLTPWIVAHEKKCGRWNLFLRWLRTPKRIFWPQWRVQRANKKLNEELGIILRS